MPLDEQALVLLRDQVPAFILGTVFHFMGLAEFGAVAIRGGGKFACLSGKEFSVRRIALT